MQTLVKLSNKIDGDSFIEYLESKGLKNVQNISYDKIRIKVIVVDSYKFFTTNVTCLSAAASLGLHPISIELYKKRYSKNKEIEKDNFVK